MTLRRTLLLLLGLAGVACFALGIRGYAAAWSTHPADPAGVMAASRSAMRALPGAALGVLLVIAAAVGWWRDGG